jgi:phosphatidylglycerol:prolipoprotein diacylglycerol transferase
LYPVLFSIPNAWRGMSGGALAAELAVVLGACALWAYTAVRRRKDLLASAASLVAFLGLAHLGVSLLMDAITIYTFGVVIILAFLAGSAYVVRRTRPLGIPDKTMFDWAFWMLIVGIAGSRLLYAYLNWEQFQEDKGEVFRIWHGGLVWYGGMIPAAAVGLYLLARQRLPVLRVADVAAAGLMLALGIGRWACLLAGDDYGRPTDLPWGIRFYAEKALVAPDLKGVALHPTQLYMSLKALWIFFFVDWIARRAKYAGTALGAMLVFYAVARAALVEPFRGDFVERNPSYGDRLALRIHLEKDAGPPVRLARGHEVWQRRTGIRGLLLEDAVLGEGAAKATVHAISVDRFSRYRYARTGHRPEWSVDAIDNLPPEVRVSSDTRTSRDPGRQGWYDSHLPVPPGFVSTSQWISLAVVLAGAGILALARRRREVGYGAALAAAAGAPPASAR